MVWFLTKACVFDQVKEVEDIKKEPEMALEKIKELEEKERMHGQTERSKARKAELQVRAPVFTALTCPTFPNLISCFFPFC